MTFVCHSRFCLGVLRRILMIFFSWVMRVWEKNGLFITLSLTWKREPVYVSWGDSFRFFLCSFLSPSWLLPSSHVALANHPRGEWVMKGWGRDSRRVKEGEINDDPLPVCVCSCTITSLEAYFLSFSSIFPDFGISFMRKRSWNPFLPQDAFCCFRNSHPVSLFKLLLGFHLDFLLVVNPALSSFSLRLLYSLLPLTFYTCLLTRHQFTFPSRMCCSYTFSLLYLLLQSPCSPFCTLVLCLLSLCEMSNFQAVYPEEEMEDASL